MKKNFIVCSCVAIAAFVAGLKIGQPNDLQVKNYETLPYKIELIKAYADYYKGAEELLDVLNEKYEWVDAIEHYHYYDSKYYLKSILNLEK
jgi:hypothetical protein